jgi:hypothetical protein
MCPPVRRADTQVGPYTTLRTSAVQFPNVPLPGNLTNRNWPVYENLSQLRLARS